MSRTRNLYMVKNAMFEMDFVFTSFDKALNKYREILNQNRYHKPYINVYSYNEEIGGYMSVYEKVTELKNDKSGRSVFIGIRFSLDYCTNVSAQLTIKELKHGAGA